MKRTRLPSRRNSRARNLALALICVLAGGCSNPFTPPDVGPTGGTPIKTLDTPDNVLDNLVYAYEQRDIDVYEELLDPGFVFVYFDPERVEGIETVIVPRDGPSGDLERTRRLLRVFDEVRLPVFHVIEASTDTTGEAVVELRRVAFQLTVRDLDGDFGFESFEATGDALFSLAQSSSDGLWRLIRWEDLSNQ